MQYLSLEVKKTYLSPSHGTDKVIKVLATYGSTACVGLQYIVRELADVT